MPGIDTSNSEITSIQRQGFWLLTANKEYFIPFESYPAFQKASVEEICDFKQISPDQFHWECLDIDIELEALENPEKFPLHF